MADMKDNLNKLKHDASDAIDEAKNRAQAAAEQLKRAAAGDSMPLGDRVVSNVKETLHKAHADVDAAKRDIRQGAADTEKV